MHAKSMTFFLTDTITQVLNGALSSSPISLFAGYNMIGKARIYDSEGVAEFGFNEIKTYTF